MVAFGLLPGEGNSLALDAGVRPDFWIHDEIPDDARPGRVARQVVIVFRSNLLQLQRANTSRSNLLYGYTSCTPTHAYIEREKQHF